MSKDGKKPGPRDISDLKARLGLKGKDKGRGGVAPPGAGKLGAFVPPPPGVAPPQPQLPDVKDDPFGAMNAMAAQQAVHRAPEIIVVDKTVEKVEEGSKAARYGKVAAIIATPLIIGFILGGINYERRRYNHNLEDAKLLYQEVHLIGKSLDELNTTMLAGRQEGRGYKLWDLGLVDSLEKLNFTLADDDKLILFHRNLYSLEPKLVQDTLTFYQRIRSLTSKVKEHIRLTKVMKDRATEAGKGTLGASTALGILLKVPTPQEANSGARTQAELVQIGNPVCADGKPAETCQGGPPVGALVRNDPNGPYQPKQLATASDTADKVVLVKSNSYVQALLEGSQKFLDELNYTNRLYEIDVLVHGPDGESGLMKERKDIEDRMNAVVQRGKALAL